MIRYGRVRLWLRCFLVNEAAREDPLIPMTEQEEKKRISEGIETVQCALVMGDSRTCHVTMMKICKSRFATRENFESVIEAK